MAADPDIAGAIGPGAWNSAMSGAIAGTTTTWRGSPTGLSITFQSGRTRNKSLPMIPAIGMNGTPFCAANSPAKIAGQVESERAKLPARTPAENRGAPPASPSEIALVSSEVTAPAPIRRSACRPLTGTQIRFRPVMPASISEAVAVIDTPALLTGIATDCPGSNNAASASSETMSVMRFPPFCWFVVRSCLNG